VSLCRAAGRGWRAEEKPLVGQKTHLFSYLPFIPLPSFHSLQDPQSPWSDRLGRLSHRRAGQRSSAEPQPRSRRRESLPRSGQELESRREAPCWAENSPVLLPSFHPLAIIPQPSGSTIPRGATSSVASAIVGQASGSPHRQSLTGNSSRSHLPEPFHKLRNTVFNVRGRFEIQ